MMPLLAAAAAGMTMTTRRPWTTIQSGMPPRAERGNDAAALCRDRQSRRTRLRGGVLNDTGKHWNTNGVLLF